LYTKVSFKLTLLAMSSKDNILNTFGENVRKYRHKLAISQEELADRANLHRTYIGMIERAEKNITLINIEKIANALGVKISDLLKN
jgi:transcriptional regulator with XRE-family HTH domain